MAEIVRGYLEDQYGVFPENAVVAENIQGMQFTAVIDDNKPAASQFLGSLTQPSPLDAQFEGAIEGTVTARGFQFLGEPQGETAGASQFYADLNHIEASAAQFSADLSDTQAFAAQSEGQINKTEARGMQLLGHINKITSRGAQVGASIVNFPGAFGSMFEWSPHTHIIDGSYLVEDYLVDSYLQSKARAIMGAQFLAQINDFEGAFAAQFEGLIESDKTGAMQFEGHIADFERAFGSQFTAYVVAAMGSQFRAALYNLDNLRILCDFPSRGVAPGNWTASTTASGDFSASNLNTDIVEQVWRGGFGVKAGITLTCDTGVPQGVFLDTLAILNHNLTTSSNVQLVGANAPDFSGTVSTTRIRMEQENSYWVAPELPLNGYRYWRLEVSDVTNPVDYLQVGTVVFGEAVIMHGENYSNPIKFKKTHYSDKVDTEGFTAAQNDRGIKRNLSLDFRSVNSNGGNYANLREVLNNSRTNLKCLWIPTPKYPGRYAVFAKLRQLPDETHVDNGENAAYVDLSLEMDESL
jgi:hypothetical protein